MLGRLLLLFLLTPAVELGLLIQVDQLIGFWPTIALIVATGITGSYLARREGLAAWRRLNERLNKGQLPGKELADGVIILVAGALLITPGVLTDLVGFLGLFSFTRAPIRRILMRRLQSRVEDGSAQIHFGAFGGRSGMGSDHSPPSEAEAPTPADRTSADWNGTSRRLPHHHSEDPTDPSQSSPDSSSQ